MLEGGKTIFFFLGGRVVGESKEKRTTNLDGKTE